MSTLRQVKTARPGWAFCMSWNEAHVCWESGDRMKSSMSSTTFMMSVRSNRVKFSG